MPKPQIEESQPVDYRDSGLDRAFLKLLSERQEIYRPSSVEARYKEINKELATMLADAGHKSVATADWKVTFTPGVNVTISRKRLVELGVPVAKIDKATVRTSYETVTVTATKAVEK